MSNLCGLPPYQKGQKRKRKKENDDDYLRWLRTLPSALSGGYPTEACHYRTARNSGVGIKPMYSAIPLTPLEHREQHRIGQYNFMPRDWWEEKVAYYVETYKRLINGNRDPH